MSTFLNRLITRLADVESWEADEGPKLEVPALSNESPYLSRERSRWEGTAGRHFVLLGESENSLKKSWTQISQRKNIAMK